MDESVRRKATEEIAVAGVMRDAVCAPGNVADTRENAEIPPGKEDTRESTGPRQGKTNTENQGRTIIMKCLPPTDMTSFIRANLPAHAGNWGREKMKGKDARRYAMSVPI